MPRPAPPLSRRTGRSSRAARWKSHVLARPSSHSSRSSKRLVTTHERATGGGSIPGGSRTRREGERASAMLAWAVVEETRLADPAQALALYREVLELDPDSVEAMTSIARIALVSGDIDGALAALVARRDRCEGAARNAIDLEIATVLLDRGCAPRRRPPLRSGDPRIDPERPGRARAERAPPRERGVAGRGDRDAREDPRRGRRRRGPGPDPRPPPRYPHGRRVARSATRLVRAAARSSPVARRARSRAGDDCPGRRGASHRRLALGAR